MTAIQTLLIDAGRALIAVLTLYAMGPMLLLLLGRAPVRRKDEEEEPEHEHARG
jgi:hypothetical protein